MIPMSLTFLSIGFLYDQCGLDLPVIWTIDALQHGCVCLCELLNEGWLSNALGFSFILDCNSPDVSPENYLPRILAILHFLEEIHEDVKS